MCQRALHGDDRWVIHRDQLRAADSERDAIAERLAAAMSEGRLDADEYQQRLERAYAARTYADLGRLVDDLPASASLGASASPRSMPEQTAPRPAEAITAWITGLPIGCLILALVLILASLA
jgi:hypothetical protein